MSIAYNYNKCYWNAAGELDCGNQTITRRTFESSIRKYPPKLPSSNSKPLFVQPSNNYAKVSVDLKNRERQVIEPHTDGPNGPNGLSGPNGRKGQYRNDAHLDDRALRSKKIMDRSDDLCQLNREMEISIYLPDRDQQFPWEHNKPQTRAPLNQPQMHPSPVRQPPLQMTPSGQLPSFKNLPQIPQKTYLPQKIYTPTRSSLVTYSSSPPNLAWNRKSKYAQNFKGKVNKYYFQTAYSKYNELFEAFGQPSLINQNKGGIAIWQHSRLKNTPYEIIKRIDLVDEQCFNNYPIPHSGFLYTYVKLDIPMNKVGNVISLCGDVMYDPVKHILIVRGMSLNYNIAIMAIICLYVGGKLTWYDIMHGSLVKEETTYEKLINKKSLKENLAVLNQFLILKKK